MANTEQRSTAYLLFEDLMLEVIEMLDPDPGITTLTLEALQEISESFLIYMIETCKDASLPSIVVAKA